MKKILLLLILLNISSCSSYIEKRGYLFDEENQKEIRIGMQKSEVYQLMGSPSTESLKVLAT